MADLQWLLELLLVGLLLATLFHALRLERALGVLKRDRAALEELVSGFNGATRQAEKGIDRLRDTADGAGRQIARQIDSVTALKEDLIFLIERGDRLADRLDGLVRNGRPAEAPAAAASAQTGHATFAPATYGEDVPIPAPFKAAPFNTNANINGNSGAFGAAPFAAAPFAAAPLAGAPFAAAPLAGAPFASAPPSFAPAAFGAREPDAPAEAGGPRVRSQAERDLLRALRMAR